MQALIFNADRNWYSAKDVIEDKYRRPMTAGELIRFLEDYDEDTPLVLSHDEGYTYGPVTEPYEWDDSEEDAR